MSVRKITLIVYPAYGVLVGFEVGVALGTIEVGLELGVAVGKIEVGIDIGVGISEIGSGLGAAVGKSKVGAVEGKLVAIIEGCVEVGKSEGEKGVAIVAGAIVGATGITGADVIFRLVKIGPLTIVEPIMFSKFVFGLTKAPRSIPKKEYASPVTKFMKPIDMLNVF